MYVYIYIYTYNHSSGKRFFCSANRLGRLCGPPNLLFHGHRSSSRGKPGRRVTLTIHIHLLPIRLHVVDSENRNFTLHTLYIYIYIYKILRHGSKVGVTAAEIIKERFQMY
jgi:hypothetical protein